MMVHLASGFAEHGFQTDLILAEARGPYLDKVAPKVRVVDLKSAGGSAGLPKPVRYLRRWGADHIHAYWASVAATTAMIAAKVSAVSWSFTAHRWDIAVPNAFRAKLESARFARFISRDGLELARPVAGPQLGEKAAIIRMGVLLTQYEISRTRPPASVALRLICAGTLIPRKGQRFLLTAVARLKAQGIAVQLFLAGEGPTQEALQAQAEPLGITDLIVFLGNVDITRCLPATPRAVTTPLSCRACTRASRWP